MTHKRVLMFRFVCLIVVILVGNPCESQTDLEIRAFDLDKDPLLLIEQPRQYGINLDLSMVVDDDPILLEYNISLFFKTNTINNRYDEQILMRTLRFTRPPEGGPRVLSDQGGAVVLTLPSSSDVCSQISEYCVEVLPVSIEIGAATECIPLDAMKVICDRPKLELGFINSPRITSASGSTVTFHTAVKLQYKEDYYASSTGTDGILKIDILTNSTDNTDEDQALTSIGNIELIGEQYRYHLSATAETMITFNISETLRLFEEVDLCTEIDDVNAICFNATPGEDSTYEPTNGDQNHLKCIAVPKITNCGLAPFILPSIVAGLVVLLFIILICIVIIKYRKRIADSEFWVNSKTPEETYNIIRRRLNVRSFYDRKPYVVELPGDVSKDKENPMGPADEGGYDKLDHDGGKHPVPVLLMSEDGNIQFNKEVDGTDNPGYQSIDIQQSHPYEDNLQSISGGSASSSRDKGNVGAGDDVSRNSGNDSQRITGSSASGQDVSGGSYVEATINKQPQDNTGTRKPSIFPVKPDLPARLTTKTSNELRPPVNEPRPPLDLPPSLPPQPPYVDAENDEDDFISLPTPPPPPMKVRYPQPKVNSPEDPQPNQSGHPDGVPALPDAVAAFDDMLNQQIADPSNAQHHSTEQDYSGGKSKVNSPEDPQSNQSDHPDGVPALPDAVAAFDDMLNQQIADPSNDQHHSTEQDYSGGKGQPPPPPPKSGRRKPSATPPAVKPKPTSPRVSQDLTPKGPHPPPPPKRGRKPSAPPPAVKPKPTSPRPRVSQDLTPKVKEKRRNKASSGVPILRPTLTGGGSTKAVAEVRRRPSIFRTNSSENLAQAFQPNPYHEQKGFPSILQNVLDTSFQTPSNTKSKRSSGIGSGTSTLKRSQAEFATLVLENYLSIIDEMGNPVEEDESHDTDANPNNGSQAQHNPHRLRPMSSIRRNSTPFLIMEQRKMSIMSAWSEGSELSDMSDIYVNKWNKKWEFDREDLELDRSKPLGEGQFGKVYMGIARNIDDREGDTKVAVKELKNDAAMEDKDEFLKELAIHTLMEPHVNVIELLGCCIRDEPLCIIIEYMKNGDLLHYLRNQRRSEPLAQHLMVNFGHQIACGMEHVSNMGIVHRDLAARNILVSEDMTCKVSDFGFARDVFGVKTYDKSPKKAPIRWYAPESILDDTFTTKTDVWSFGILMFEIITMGFFLPYHKDPSTATVRVKIATGGVPPKPPYCNDELYRIMKRCWSREPDDRPEFSELADILAKLDDKYEPVSPFGETEA